MRAPSPQRSHLHLQPCPPGASRGIGLEVAAKLAAAGAQVTLLARDGAKAAAAAERCGNGTRHVTADLLDLTALRAATRAALEGLGGLDLLVIAGGNSGSEYLGLDPNAPESFRLLQAIHVEATLALVQVRY